MILHLLSIIPLVLSVALAILGYEYNQLELKIIASMVLMWGLLLHANTVKAIRQRQQAIINSHIY